MCLQCEQKVSWSLFLNGPPITFPALQSDPNANGRAAREAYPCAEAVYNQVNKLGQSVGVKGDRDLLSSRKITLSLVREKESQVLDQRYH